MADAHQDFTDKGKWVEIKQGKLPDPDAPWTTVTDRFEVTLAKAEDMLKLLVGPDGESGYLGDLNKAIQAAPSVTVTAPNVDTGLVLKTGKTEVPDFDPSLLGDYPNESYPAPTLADLPDIDVSGLRSVPDVPEVNAQLLWNGTPFTSDIYPDLLARLLDNLRNGSSWVEDAIYRRARTRQQADRLKLHEDLQHQASQMQFQYPSGVLISALNGFAIAANRMDAEIEDNIVVEQLKNSQFIIEQSIRLEEILRRHWNDDEARRLDYEKSKIDLLLRNYAERIRAMTARIEAERAYVQAQADYLRGVIDANRGKVDIYKAQYEALSTRINAVATRNKGLTDTYVALVNAYGEEARAITSWNQGEIEKLKARVQAADLQLRAAIANAEKAIQGYGTEMSLREKVASSMAGIAAQAVASWAGAVNASASLSYSGSESKSESWSHSENLSESHSYEEEAPALGQDYP